MHHKEILICSLVLLFRSCSSRDTISQNQALKDGDILVSSGGNFALGFFSPGKSGNRYVGIWYNKVSEQTVVWVANSDNPINGSNGVLAINHDGNLVLFDEIQNLSVWSINVNSMDNLSSAQLMETGNFLLFRDQSRSVIAWQSFDVPTNTILPGMKFGWNRQRGPETVFTSWKSSDDPGTGEYFSKMELSGKPEWVLYKGTEKIWRTGPWNGLRFSGVPAMVRDFILYVNYTENDDEVSYTYQIKDPSIFSMLVLNESGTLERYYSQGPDHGWVRFWYAPIDQCDNYAHCATNSDCDLSNPSKFECSCLPGYEPVEEREWFLRDASGGCKRKTGENMCGNGEGFIKFTNKNLPDTSSAYLNKNIGLRECQDLCLKNCSCTAFASANITEGGTGCLAWIGDLVDIRQFSDNGQDLYIRVPAVELARYKKKTEGFRGKRLAATVASSITGILLIILLLICWLLRKNRKGANEEAKPIFSTGLASFVSKRNNIDGNGTGTDDELTVFDLDTIIAATDGFSPSNKLGEGGFGAVYKGRLQNGQEIAVKRLSKISGQGTEEFKNEMTLIARLQHRNLVRLLGCCIQQDEKMIVYEYLPNKALDYFIFDKARRSVIGWSKRFEIILGIARGMIYLHEDSRLRIIHRDLKASNILLDSSMNPKISDFGLARIFGGDQIEANTNRVVGTYGYMAPEYAMQGLFSIKSDVYSFGVLLVEIICGRKNSSFFQNDAVNLIGHVWNLWREERVSDIIDSSLENSCDIVNKVLRCIHVGLLCVQDYASDRPTMSEVAFMLSNETNLPYPKQPAFIFRQFSTTATSSSASAEKRSMNNVSISEVEAR